MNTYNCTLELSNKAEWLKHISSVVDLGYKCSEELLRDICAFGFKFDTISQ